MFQSFDVLTDPKNGPIRLAKLRKEMAERGLDGFIVPRGDEHQGEYVPARAERLSWLTGFTGSAGSAIILAREAAIFIDGRYTLQVRDQVDLNVLTPESLVENPPAKWLSHHAKPGMRIGFDPWMHSVEDAAKLRKALRENKAELVAVESNLVDAVWDDQPDAPLAPVVPHPSEIAGLSSEQKRLQIGEVIHGQGQDVAVLTQPESIAWLLNIRGGDVPHTPFPLGFAILGNDGRVDLFMDKRKIDSDTMTHLGNAVRLFEPDQFEPELAKLSGKIVRLDPKTASEIIRCKLDAAGAQLERDQDPCMLPKACKNPAELDGMRRAHVRDGAAVSKFLHFLSEEAASGKLDEISAAKRLEAFRGEAADLKELSFDTISGAGSNGAIVHYRVNTATNRPIQSGELYLVDSGAQYPDGTTDITRTIAVGEPSDEMRDRFTRVLKGHIALARARFPAGTKGVHLDILARQPLWDAGLDYDHGTGHGVGAYLSVHEGPQNISKGLVDVALQEGMVCSNEPGYYKEGGYGIRIENLIIVTEATPVPGGERPLLGFETITLAPIDLNLVEKSLLNDAEVDWLNSYHERVYDAVAPQVDEDQKAWLKSATRAI